MFTEKKKGVDEDVMEREMKILVFVCKENAAEMLCVAIHQTGCVHYDYYWKA